MPSSDKRIQRAWTFYDWANSSYNLVITSTMFPAYYEEVTKAADGSNRVKFLGMEFVNTALYNYALAVAFLVVAFMSPILSSIADYKGNKKTFLRVFSTIGSISCASMYMFDANHLGIGIAAVILACIGFWSSWVFYNSYLPEIAPDEERDRLSARGFSMGYTGSVILQLGCFVLLFKKEWFGFIGIETAGDALRTSFLAVGIWWFGFAQIPLKILPNGTPATARPNHGLLANGFIELKKVWAQLKLMPVLKRFLTAFFFYNMGVQTVMLAATLYGKSELAIPVDNLIIAILLIQLVAIPGALFLSWCAGKIGNLNTLLATVLLWVGICVAGYNIKTGDVTAFYGLAAVVGFVMGGIQSVSRSTYARLMPVTRDTTSFFSFYDVTEKIAIVIGMFSFGFITELAGGSQRNSVLALMGFFIMGAVWLLIAKQAERKHSAS